MRPFLRLVGLLSALLLAGIATAQERILSFHSDIAIAEDASMVVTESIHVVAEGRQIRRGIYRDFPTRYRDRYGNEYRVGFEVLSLTRDGAEEPWRTEKRANGIRVYAGSASVFLPSGEYRYELTYRTDWQIGFFDDRDELYWNVTGNGWDFFIERASARVTLPGIVPRSEITLEGYTGRQGSRDRNFEASLRDGEGSISSTVSLRPREGLTLVMRWPKGVIEEPGQMQRLLHLLAANLGLLLASLACGGSALYLGLMWHRHGRDPAEGVIFPHYEPPPGYTPGALRYVRRMGYDNETFSAAIVSLAVKGYVDIHNESGDFTLKRKPSTAELSPAERKLVDRLFSGGARLVLDDVNHRIISRARQAHRKALAGEYRGLYFKTNGLLLAPSAVATFLLFILILFTDVVVPMVIALFGATIALHLLFLWLMKAPSPRGRRLMDKSEGFKLYLEVAEKDDLNLRNPPDMTPELFEAYLPYAIALGVEQSWAEQFSAILASVRDPETGDHYHPRWYHGHFNAAQMGSFSQTVGSGFNTAISSAATAPGSSSGGGGGGFSGGGGGGGGGGGW